jgi:hypothetical protein
MTSHATPKNSQSNYPNNKKLDFDEAIKIVSLTPETGEMKQGDLADVQVYTFRMNHQLVILVYSFETEILSLYYYQRHTQNQ